MTSLSCRDSLLHPRAAALFALGHRTGAIDAFKEALAAGAAHMEPVQHLLAIQGAR